MKREEQKIHQTIVQHLRTRAQRGVVWWHSPNGGWRSPVEAKIFQSLGVRAGVADLVLLHDGQFFALELKAPGGRLTESQAAFLDDVEAAGGVVACAEGLDAALRKLERWGLLRGTGVLKQGVKTNDGRCRKIRAAVAIPRSATWLPGDADSRA